VDTDNQTNTVSYNGSFTAQISEVDGPYGTKATFGYDGSGPVGRVRPVGGVGPAYPHMRG
jgi:hypothetical protein